MASVSASDGHEQRTSSRGARLFADVLDSADISASEVPGNASSSAENATTETVASTPDATAVDTDANVSRETVEGDGGDLVAVPGTSFAELRLDQIIPNSRQPRQIFDEDELNELAASIREVGVLQPVVVRPIDTEAEPSAHLKEYLEEKPDARFELIMGERRLRASELAGNTRIPAIIRRTEDADLLRDALLENLHRAQLNPLEEASAYQQLMADFGATQEELSVRIARSRSQIANTLRLLKLPAVVQRKVAAGVISAGHARALLGLTEPIDMEHLAERIVAEGLSVRTTEELVRLHQVQRPARTGVRRPRAVSALGTQVVNALQDRYDTRVTITEGRRKGKIVIEFAGSEDLERISALILGEGIHTRE